MQSRGSPLETLVYSVLPGLSQLPPRERQGRVDELVEYADDILASRLPSSIPLGAGGLPDAARRLLPTNGDALRFNALWNTVERNRTLSAPSKQLQFLLALSSLNRTSEPTFAASPRRQHTRTDSYGLGTPAPPRAAAPLGEPSRSPASPSKLGRSKAELLREWRTERGRRPFPEHLLLRDALYLLQGIDGRYVRFAVAPPPERNPYLTERGREGDGTGFPLGANGVAVPVDAEPQVVGIDVVADEPREGYIAKPTRNILVQLSELGVLYHRITTFIKEHQAAGPSSRSGMVVQSLCHFLHHELSEYHRLLAVLESQMDLTGPGEIAPPESGLTLIRLGLWTEDMRLKLRLMGSIVNDAVSAHGGALVSKIHKHTAHGDPLVRRFTDQILEEVSKPFFLTLQRWIISGELHDPFNEFFVQPNPEITSDDVNAYAAGDLGFEEGLDSGGGTNDAHQMWEKRYIFVKAMMPGFINEDFGKKIFSTGRSLNFIRYNCYDSDWVSEQAALSKLEALKYSDLNGLERSIDVAYSKASKHLLQIFYEKYHLMDHLVALKSYLMLGAGDFVDLLMESLSTRLDRPAISLYRHHLTSDLESAIRGSSAQYDPPDVLRRLDARVNEYSRGEIGWDCFALEYRVESPLNAVLDARAMEGYARLFHHLWRLKRVETALTEGWMRVTAASRAFDALPSQDGLWHSSRLAQAEMVHFLRNMQAFCQLEVIECSWTALREITDRRDGDLDALISAHRTYLDRVVRKILLLGVNKDDSLLRLVQEALGHILAFKAATEDLFKWSLGEATRLDRIRGIERGLSADDSRAAEAEGTSSREELEEIRSRISKCSLGFQDTVGSVCKEAAAHADLDVRFLAIRIAFNGHYSMRRGKKKAA
ncbi:hypothetical protein CspHIS471_0507450 [Cutaneotrichosporon sp. HIS471]|nr:hypothetical protein CspHIS471_0507450 [Cutaneotrichosporon sp. HIS471]